MDNLADGIYIYNGYTGSGGTNTPGATMGIFLQMTNDAYGNVVQLIISGGTTPFRIRWKGDGSWKAWYKLSGATPN